MLRTITFATALAAAGCAAAQNAPDVAGADRDAKHAAMKHEMAKEDRHMMGPHIIETKSNQDFAATLAALQAAVDRRDFKTFAIIDHAKGAASIDQPLPPTTLVIFGNPQGGTPLMQAAQTIAIDLPLKALVYQNGDKVMIAVPDIKHLLHEHGVEGKEDLADKIAGALAAVSEEAANAGAEN